MVLFMANRRNNKSAGKATTTIIGYARKSTDEAGKQEQSIAIQRDAILDFAAKKGLVVGGFFFDEGVSGSAPIEECAGLTAALAAIKDTSAAHLLCHRTDRLARSISKHFEVKRLVEACGATIVSVEDGIPTGDDDATLIKEVITSLQGQLFLNQLKRRVREGMAKKKASGKAYCRRTPYGFKKAEDGTLVPDEREQSAIQRMKQLDGLGYSTLAAAKILTAEGFTSRDGAAFSQATIYRIVRKAA